MVSILLVVNALICVALIILILLQRTDPAAGGMFGGTGGAGGPAIRNPLARPTAWLAAAFLAITLVLAVLGKGQGGGDSVMAALPETPAEPALPAPVLLPATATSPSVPAATASPTVASPTTAVQ